MIYPSFQAAVERAPDKPAVIAARDSLSYAELLQRIQSTVTRLEQLGVQPGDAVAILLPNGIDFVVFCLAILARKAIAVPISTRFQAEEVQYYLDSSQASLVIHGEMATDMLSGIAPALARLDIDAEAAQLTPGPEQVIATASEDVPAIYMYSSGSTGKPKRVTRTHGQLMAEFQSLASTIALNDSDRILCTVPLYHAHGFNNCLLAALLSGGTLVLMEGEFSPREATRQLQTQRITIYPAVPFMLKMIAEAFYPAKPDLSSVRLLFTAGAPLPLAVADRFHEVFGLMPRQLYGSTETGAVAINYDGDQGAGESVGLPLDGIRIDILDEAGQPLPTGEVGEIAIASPAMTTRYDALPELTAECFQRGYFLPGDLGLKDAAGRIYIKGRKKLLINVAGNKVDPLDVEALIKTHPKVQEVVVLGCPDPNYGEMVKAVVVATADCTESEIVALCNQHLAWYKVPKRVEFRAEIPRSPLGKILRKYLQDDTIEVQL